MPEEREPYDNQSLPSKSDPATVLAQLVNQFDMPQRQRFADAMKWALVTGGEQRIHSLINDAVNGRLA